MVVVISPIKWADDSDYLINVKSRYGGEISEYEIGTYKFINNSLPNVNI